MSMQNVPSQTRCEMILESSIPMTRKTVHRGVISMPKSRSAPNVKAMLFPTELR